MKLATRVENNLKEQETLHAELLALQEQCLHETVTKTYKSNTGNYDPGCDAYWIDWNCPECHKRWTTPQ